MKAPTLDVTTLVIDSIYFLVHSSAEKMDRRGTNIISSPFQAFRHPFFGTQWFFLFLDGMMLTRWHSIKNRYKTKSSLFCSLQTNTNQLEFMATDETKVLGKRIRKLREWLDFSQKCMAIQLGITQSHYSKIERGELSISCRRMEQIAAIFGISVEALTNGRFAQLPFEK